jgi:hypothetical protein
MNLEALSVVVAVSVVVLAVASVLIEGRLKDRNGSEYRALLRKEPRYRAHVLRRRGRDTRRRRGGSGEG